MSFWLSGSAAASAALLLACAAHAADVKAKSADIPLGTVPRYADESAARAACQPDAVVWADPKTGFYYPKYFPQYGTTERGAYTCYKQAEKADYWNIAPASSARDGREFPQFFCYTCS